MVMAPFLNIIFSNVFHIGAYNPYEKTIPVSNKWPITWLSTLTSGAICFYLCLKSLCSRSFYGSLHISSDIRSYIFSSERLFLLSLRNTVPILPLPGCFVLTSSIALWRCWLSVPTTRTKVPWGQRPSVLFTTWHQHLKQCLVCRRCLIHVCLINKGHLVKQ